MRKHYSIHAFNHYLFTDINIRDISFGFGVYFGKDGTGRLYNLDLGIIHFTMQDDNY